MTEQAVSESLAPTSTAPSPVKARRTRTVITWILVVLFGILTPITIVSGWAVETVTNTNRYVSTMQPLAKDPVITNYIADESTQKLFTQFKVEDKVRQQLPAPVRFLAAPLTQQLQTYTDKAVRAFLQTSVFQSFWDKENRFMQANLVAILEGKNPPPISKTRAAVINITPMIVTAIDQLNAKGITVFNPIRNELETNRALALQLISPKQLATARTIFSLAILGRTTLFFLTPIVAIAAILIAWRRRVTALRLAIAGLIGSIFSAVLLKVLKTLFTSSAPGAQGPLAAAHVFDTLFRYMRTTTNWLIIIFAVLSVVLWLVGPSTWAQATRRVAVSSKTKVVEATGEALQSETGQKAVAKLHRVIAWMATHLKVLAWTGAIVAALGLLIAQSTGSIVLIIVLIAVYELVLVAIAFKGKSQQTELAETPTEREHQDA